MDMTKDIIDYTQKHTDTAERLIASYQSPVSEISDGEASARACATSSPFQVSTNIVDAKLVNSPKAHNELTINTVASEMHTTAAAPAASPQADAMEQQQQQQHAHVFASATNADATADTSAKAQPPIQQPPKNTGAGTGAGAVMSGDITPPPRPFTTSEVVGLSSA
ncbi:PREDICTED: uncharacterized protein LOC108379587, partial [Rhagoletis zephyria]|uniref:uncharacterized protein LOC108379587 n=1 Tax=Rhagoletis zephyria TaxID=28612 RepID=UPI0008114DA2